MEEKFNFDTERKVYFFILEEMCMIIGVVSRFWHWHTRFCPGWKAFMKSLPEAEQKKMRIKYDLK